MKALPLEITLLKEVQGKKLVKAITSSDAVRVN